MRSLVATLSPTAMSLNTLNTYLDHGVATPTLERNLLEVIQLLGELKTLGIDLDRVSTQLERESIGVLETNATTALTRPVLAA
jgi:hypothetical protein